MEVLQILLYVAVAIVGTIIIAAVVRLVWLAIGAYKITRAGPRRLSTAHHVIWRDPGAVELLDMTNGPGGPSGAPDPPFRFLEEHATGSQPCVSILDARGRRWRVKWGNEVRSENFAVRLAWACGYFVETTYFVHEGVIDGARELQRARVCIDEHCRFVDARFELDEADVRKMFEEHSWAWNDNPFLGTSQLHGLKMLVMLLSNWDSKDRRDVARGSNTAIFEYKLGPWRREARYLITDWGGSMGRWGGNIVTRGRWDPEGFATQTEQFVTGVQDGILTFGYTGQRTADMTEGIRVEDARWLDTYLGRISDAQLREALRASGASREDTESFAKSIRSRIDQIAGAARGTKDE